MSYRYRTAAPRPQIITIEDVGTHVTVAVRKASGPGVIYVSGEVQTVTGKAVTIGVMHHPTGPWDRWESHEVPTTIEHRRIVRRA